MSDVLPLYMRLINDKKDDKKMLFCEGIFQPRSTEEDISKCFFNDAEIPQSKNERSVMIHEVIIELDATEEFSNPLNKISLEKLQNLADQWIDNVVIPFLEDKAKCYFWVTDHRKKGVSGKSKHIRFLINEDDLKDYSEDVILKFKKWLTANLIKQCPLNKEQKKYLQIDDSFNDKNKLCPMEGRIHYKHKNVVRVVYESKHTEGLACPKDKLDAIVKEIESYNDKEVVKYTVSQLDKFDLDGFARTFKEVFRPTETNTSTMFFSSICRRFGLSKKDSLNIFNRVMKIYKDDGYYNQFSNFDRMHNERLVTVRYCFRKDVKTKLKFYWSEKKSKKDNTDFINKFTKYFKQITRNEESKKAITDTSLHWNFNVAISNYEAYAKKILDDQPLYYDDHKRWWKWDKIKWVQIQDHEIIQYIKEAFNSFGLSQRQLSWLIRDALWPTA